MNGLPGHLSQATYALEAPIRRPFESQASEHQSMRFVPPSTSTKPSPSRSRIEKVCPWYVLFVVNALWSLLEYVNEGISF
jgi:hypothetical protein